MSESSGASDPANVMTFCSTLTATVLTKWIPLLVCVTHALFTSFSIFDKAPPWTLALLNVVGAFISLIALIVQSPFIASGSSSQWLADSAPADTWFVYYYLTIIQCVLLRIESLTGLKRRGSKKVFYLIQILVWWFVGLAAQSAFFNRCYNDDKKFIYKSDSDRALEISIMVTSGLAMVVGAGSIGYSTWWFYNHISKTAKRSKNQQNLMTLKLNLVSGITTVIGTFLLLPNFPILSVDRSGALLYVFNVIRIFDLLLVLFVSSAILLRARQRALAKKNVGTSTKATGFSRRSTMQSNSSRHSKLPPVTDTLLEINDYLVAANRPKMLLPDSYNESLKCEAEECYIRIMSQMEAKIDIPPQDSLRSALSLTKISQSSRRSILEAYTKENTSWDNVPIHSAHSLTWNIPIKSNVWEISEVSVSADPPVEMEMDAVNSEC